MTKTLQIKLWSFISQSPEVSVAGQNFEQRLLSVANSHVNSVAFCFVSSSYFIFIFCVMLLLEDGSRSLFSTKQGDVIVTSCKQWLSFIHKHPRSAWFLYWPVRWQTADNIIIQMKMPRYIWIQFISSVIQILEKLHFFLKYWSEISASNNFDRRAGGIVQNAVNAIPLWRMYDIKTMWKHYRGKLVLRR